MPIVSSLICPNVREIGCLQPCCKTAVLESEEFSKRKPRGKTRPSSCVYNNLSKNVPLRSHYCPEELKHPEYGRRVSRSYSMATQRLSGDGEGGGGSDVNSECDVTFVRKLLALNKKEEILLNKKLTKLLKDKQFGNSAGRHLPCEGCISVSAPNFVNRKKGSINEKFSPESKETERSLKSLQAPQRPTAQQNKQYDLNGRRIYNLSDDDEEEDEKESISQLEKYNIGKSWRNSITVMKCDPASNSTGKIKAGMGEVAHTNQLTIGVNKSKRSEENADEENASHSTLFRRAEKTDGGLQSSWEGIQATSQGDGVQNVVVHCSKVAKSDLDTGQEKRVVKVWNFNSIPKMKSGARTKLNKIDARGDERLPGSKGNRDQNTTKEGKHNKLKNDKNQSSRKIKNPPNDLF